MSSEKLRNDRDFSNFLILEEKVLELSVLEWSLLAWWNEGCQPNRFLEWGQF